jgi:hypothetical protein
MVIFWALLTSLGLLISFFFFLMRPCLLDFGLQFSPGDHVGEDAEQVFVLGGLHQFGELVHEDAREEDDLVGEQLALVDVVQLDLVVDGAEDRDRVQFYEHVYQRLAVARLHEDVHEADHLVHVDAVVLLFDEPHEQDL